jgi:hypothetical protein
LQDSSSFSSALTKSAFTVDIWSSNGFFIDELSSISLIRLLRACCSSTFLFCAASANAYWAAAVCGRKFRKSDIVEPLLLNLPETSNPLKVSVLKGTRPQNRVILYSVNDVHKIHVDFEYIEPRQGFNLEVLLTGEVKGDPWPTGVIIGMPLGFRKFSEGRQNIIYQLVQLVLLVVVIAAAIIIPQTKLVDKSYAGPIAIASVICMGLAMLSAPWWPRIFTRRGIPRDLRT